MLERKDRIKEETTTTGTGTVSLSGTAPTGFRTFVSAVTSGATVRYLIETTDQSEWEVGEGVFTDGTPDTLTRVTVYASSNAGSLVDFSAGTKNVALVFTANDALELTNETPYKIVPSVTSNNLTVAIKHLDGSDPSAGNPIRKRIGDEIREITSALSAELTAGTNWCNAGSSELATKEIDYFTYLSWETLDSAVRIGVSRYPAANVAGDLAASSTDEKGRKWDNVPANTDIVEVIGRFAATLSAGAGYTWSVPTFTAVNLINRPIYESRLLDWQPSYGGNSSMTYTSVTTSKAKYRIDRNDVYFGIFSSGITGGTASNFIYATTPFTPAANVYTSGNFYRTGLSDWQVSLIQVITAAKITCLLYTGGNFTLASDTRIVCDHRFYI